MRPGRRRPAAPSCGWRGPCAPDASAAHKINPKKYTGKTTINVWDYESDPTLIDTDYDGIPDGQIDYDGTQVERDRYSRKELDYAVDRKSVV